MHGGRSLEQDLQLPAHCRLPAVSGAVLFRAGRQVTMVWLVNGLALLCAAGSSWAGVYLAQNYGLEPADGGVLHPLPVRLIMGGTVASLGLSFLGGMLVYARCYVVQIQQVAQDTLQFGLLWPGLEVRVQKADLAGTASHAGVTQGRIPVNAPWLALRLRGRRLPLIVDEQGEWLANGPGWLRHSSGIVSAERPQNRPTRRR
jgi:hypothetical protein